MCQSEKAQWCLLVSQEAANGHFAMKLQRVTGMIRIKWWQGAREKTDCCYSQGHLHRSLLDSLKTNHHLLGTQPAQPNHSNLLVCHESVFRPHQYGNRLKSVIVSTQKHPCLPVCSYWAFNFKQCKESESAQHQTTKHDRAGSFWREEVIDFSSISPLIW